MLNSVVAALCHSMASSVSIAFLYDFGSGAVTSSAKAELPYLFVGICNLVPLRKVGCSVIGVAGGIVLVRGVETRGGPKASGKIGEVVVGAGTAGIGGGTGSSRGRSVWVFPIVSGLGEGVGVEVGKPAVPGE